MHNKPKGLTVNGLLLIPFLQKLGIMRDEPKEFVVRKKFITSIGVILVYIFIAMLLVIIFGIAADYNEKQDYYNEDEIVHNEPFGTILSLLPIICFIILIAKEFFTNWTNIAVTENTQEQVQVSDLSFESVFNHAKSFLADNVINQRTFRDDEIDLVDSAAVVKGSKYLSVEFNMKNGEQRYILLHESSKLKEGDPFDIRRAYLLLVNDSEISDAYRVREK
jgi:hypothetical protein